MTLNGISILGTNYVVLNLKILPFKRFILTREKLTLNRISILGINYILLAVKTCDFFDINLPFLLKNIYKDRIDILLMKKELYFKNIHDNNEEILKEESNNCNSSMIFPRRKHIYRPIKYPIQKKNKEKDWREACKDRFYMNRFYANRKVCEVKPKLVHEKRRNYYDNSLFKYIIMWPDHSEFRRPRFVIDQRKMFNCSYLGCLKRYKSMNGLKYHLKKTHNEEVVKNKSEL